MGLKVFDKDPIGGRKGQSTSIARDMSLSEADFTLHMYINCIP